MNAANSNIINNQPMYLVTRRFLDGGPDYTGTTSVPFEVGERIYGGGWLGPKYRVISCQQIS